VEENITKRNKIIVIGICILIMASTILFIESGKKRIEARNLEATASEKENTYNRYIEKMKDIADSNMKADQVEVAKISYEALNRIEDNEYRYKKIKKGDEFVEKLRAESTKNLNDALHFLLSDSLEKSHYEEIWVFANNETYVNKENIALFNERREEFEHAEYLAKQEERESIMSKSPLGLSEGEIKLVAGNPDRIVKSAEAEFWTYGDVVLTMKNGYVYEITSAN